MARGTDINVHVEGVGAGQAKIHVQRGGYYLHFCPTAIDACSATPLPSIARRAAPGRGGRAGGLSEIFRAAYIFLVWGLKFSYDIIFSGDNNGRAKIWFSRPLFRDTVLS